MAKNKTSFKKGEATGRPKGAINHTTKNIKEAYQKLIENNLDNMQNWLNQIAEDDPAKAINILMGLSEYVVPKLARAEINTTTTNAKPLLGAELEAYEILMDRGLLGVEKRENNLEDEEIFIDIIDKEKYIHSVGVKYGLL